MTRFSTRLLVLTLAAFCAIAAFSQAPSKDTVLKATDITQKLFPASVFYRGQTASSQMRNTGGVHYTDDMYVLAGLVDNSGYSSGVKAKYQAMLLSEVPLDINGQ